MICPRCQSSMIPDNNAANPFYYEQTTTNVGANCPCGMIYRVENNSYWFKPIEDVKGRSIYWGKGHYVDYYNGHHWVHLNAIIPFDMTFDRLDRLLILK